MIGMVPCTGGWTIGIVATLSGGLMTPLRALPPGTSAVPEGKGAGKPVCGPLLSGAGLTCAITGIVAARTLRTTALPKNARVLVWLGLCWAMSLLLGCETSYQRPGTWDVAACGFVLEKAGHDHPE
jgi:hypothetical protein